MNFGFKYLLELIENNDFVGVFNYIGEYIPKTLYKYYFLYDETNKQAIEENQKRFSTLENNKLWLSDFKKFNDPFEAQNFYTDIQKLKQVGYTDEDIESLKFAQDLIESHYKATSFSTHINDCMPMWAHYSNNYKGYCVQYEVLNTKYFLPVFYEDERNASTIIARLVNNLFKCGENPTEEMQKRVFQEGIILMLSYCVKHKSWEYENEYRIIIPEFDNLKSCNDLGLKPVKIFAGLNTTETHIVKLQEISEKLGLDKVLRCKTNENKYQLDFE